MTDNLKIGLVTSYPPSKTMLNEYGYHLAKHLATKNEVKELQLYVESLPTGTVYKESDKKQKFIPSWRYNKLFNSFFLLRHIKKNRPEIVIINLHIHLFGSNRITASIGLILPLLLKLNGFKTIVLLHQLVDTDWQANSTKNPFKKRYSITGWINSQLTKAILRADVVGVTVASQTDFLREKYKKNNVVLLPHGAFEVPAVLDFKLPAGPLKILTFGRFGYHKKLEDLITAFSELKTRTEMDLRLIVAGTDHPKSQGYLEEVRRKFAHISGIQFSGYIAEQDIPKLFKESALVVFPYTMSTGTPGVLHQACSYGKVSVMPGIFPLREAVIHEGYKAEYYEAGSSLSLRTTLEKLINNPKYRNELERANYKAASSLSMEDIVDWYLIHIEKLTAA